MYFKIIDYVFDEYLNVPGNFLQKKCLPPPTKSNGQINLSNSPCSDPGKIINGITGDLPDIHLWLMKDRNQSGLWNELIERYYYLGFNPLP